MSLNKKNYLIYTFRFYLLLIKDLIWIPISYIKNKLSNHSILKRKKRDKVEDQKVYVCIHEWGGYPLIRNKTLKNGQIFECGLEGQLARYKPYREKGKIELTVTMSDTHLTKNIDSIKSQSDHFIEVSNKGLDFSGYSSFFNKIKNNPNAYIILTNSSVNSINSDFLDNYIYYMEQNPDIGILGISYSTKIYQTLVRNNFTPHIQSFFLLTTIKVLNEIVEQNNNKFPGENITHKLLLIREGEIKLSQIALGLGYNLAIIMPETGKPFKFTNKEQWDMPKGDLRLHIQHPNIITPLS